MAPEREVYLHLSSGIKSQWSVLRYVLLHHVMGGLEGMQGAWGYVQGGMGALSDAITSSATAHGASVFTEKVNVPLPLTLSICKDLSIEPNVKFRRSLL